MGGLVDIDTKSSNTPSITHSPSYPLIFLTISVYNPHSLYWTILPSLNPSFNPDVHSLFLTHNVRSLGVTIQRSSGMVVMAARSILMLSRFIVPCRSGNSFSWWGSFRNLPYMYKVNYNVVGLHMYCSYMNLNYALSTITTVSLLLTAWWEKGGWRRPYGGCFWEG